MLSTKEKIIQKLDSFSESELSQLLDFVEQIKQETLEDNSWVVKAKKAREEGFIGIEESELLLKEILNA